MWVVGQGSADALHVLKLAWYIDQACSCLLENVTALCHSSASKQVAGLECNDTIPPKHSEMFSFNWYKVDVSLAHVRKASSGTAWLRCHITHENTSWHIFLGVTEVARMPVKELFLSEQASSQLILPSGREGTCKVRKFTIIIKSGSKGDSLSACVCTFSFKKFRLWRLHLIQVMSERIIQVRECPDPIGFWEVRGTLGEKNEHLLLERFLVSPG